jgi:hypothetical protein
VLRRIIGVLLGIGHLFSSLPLIAGSDSYHTKVFEHRVLWDVMEDWRLYARYDFGSGEKMKGAGSRFRDMVAWSSGMVRTGTTDHHDAYLSDFIEGEDATLLIAVEPLTRTRILLTLGDAEAPRGPISVYVYDDLVVEGLETAAGEFKDVQLEATGMGNRIYVRVEAADCRTFAVNGVGIYTLRNQKPEEIPLLYSAPSFETEGEATSVDGDRDRVLATLRTYADFLLALQPREGGFSYNGAWYECGYPVRMLLAASELLDQPAYRDAALTCVDRFVAERGEDGDWGSSFFGTAGCEIAMRTLAEETSRNLADTATMAMCLPLAAMLTGGDREEKYLEIARDHADRVVLPAQLDSGAFPNLLWQGVQYGYPYSVATATQAMSLAALFGATGEKSYLDAASRAALFLTRTFNEDGTVDFHPHDADTTLLLSAERFGDVFYIIEGLIWVHRYAELDTRKEIAEALDRFFLAPRMKEMWENPATWFLMGSSWETSKRSGFLYLVEQYRTTVNPGADVSAIREGLLEFLGNETRREWMGVLSEPGAPRSHFALVATGFAGLGMVSLVEPGVLFPDSN